MSSTIYSNKTICIFGGRKFELNWDAIHNELGDNSKKYEELQTQKTINTEYINNLIANFDRIHHISVKGDTHRKYYKKLEEPIKKLNDIKNSNIDVSIINYILSADRGTYSAREITGIGLSIYGIKVMISRYFKYRNAYPLIIHNDTSKPSQSHRHIKHFQPSQYTQMKHKPIQSNNIPTKVYLTSINPSITNITYSQSEISEAQQKDYNECFQDIKVIYAMVTLCTYSITDVSRTTRSNYTDGKISDKFGKIKSNIRCISSLKSRDDSDNTLDFMFNNVFKVNTYWIGNNSDYKELKAKIITSEKLQSIQNNIYILSEYDIDFINWVRDSIAIFPLYILPRLFESQPTHPHFTDIIDIASQYISQIYKPIYDI